MAPFSGAPFKGEMPMCALSGRSLASPMVSSRATLSISYSPSYASSSVWSASDASSTLTCSLCTFHSYHCPWVCIPCRLWCPASLPCSLSFWGSSGPYPPDCRVWAHSGAAVSSRQIFIQAHHRSCLLVSHAERAGRYVALDAALGAVPAEGCTLDL